MDAFRTDRERKAHQRKNELIDAALIVFSKKGFTGSTTKDIAAEAGVTDGLIYHYFASKEELLWAVIDKHHFTGEIRRILQFSDNLTIQEVFNRLFIRLLELMHQNEHFLVMLFGEAQRNPKVADKIQTLIRYGVDILSAFLEKRIERGDIKKGVQTRHIARHFLNSCFIYFLTHDRFQPKDDQERKAYVQTVVHVLCQGMTTE